MAEDVTYTNTYMIYWENKPYLYPNNDNTAAEPQIMLVGAINTGWHVIPAILWKHFTTPKQWIDFMINYEAYTVKGYSITIYNPVPMTQQLAIQGTTAFTAFNNTIYTLGAQDDIYETNYHNWYDNNRTGDFKHFNVAFKEGQFKTTNNSWKKTMFPTYFWQTANPRNISSSTYGYLTGRDSYTTWPRDQSRKIIPNGIFWDPLNDPDSIMELRPGKNAMSFAWNIHECDANKWFNLDQICKWYPYTVDCPWLPQNMGGPSGAYKLSTEDDPDQLTSESSWTTQTPSKDDFTIPNLLDMPIVPMQWWWQEIQKSIAQNPDIKKLALFWAGTEYESYKYGPTQCFIKGLPLFDADGTHVNTLTQGCFRISLHLACKKRRSRIFAPTWGPLSWKQVYAMDAPRIPCLVRYRSGGARRTWTNMQANAREEADRNYSHREDPYDSTTTYGRTAPTTTITTAKTPITDATGMWHARRRGRVARDVEEMETIPEEETL